MDLYAQNIMDHYKSPRNWGRLSDATVSRHEANHSCGDIIDIDLKLKDDKISEFKYQGEGCAISLAATSIVGEHMPTKNIQKILDLKEKDIQKYLGIPISSRRQKCALMGLLAIQNALLKNSNQELRGFSDLTE